MGQLDDKVAVVIGGYSGFGRAISELFAREGAHVVVAARDGEAVQAMATRVGGTGVVCDIVDDDSVRALARTAVSVSGSIDIGVNCAGFAEFSPLRDLTPDRLHAMQSVQLTGALYAMRHLCNAMADGGGGAFLSLSSLTAHNPAIGLAAYASAKAGLEYATKIAAVEYGPQGVRVNAIAAALIETPMTAAIFAIGPRIAAQIEMTPLRRMGSVDDIANAALYLCGPMGTFVSGHILFVDGGASCQMLPSPQMYADVAARQLS